MTFINGIPEDLKNQMWKFTKIFIVAALVFFYAFKASGIASEVGTLYFRYAEAMVDGKVPYSDFSAEYPPFAMVLILLPRLISISSFTYQLAFGLEVFFFLLAGLYFTYRIAGQYTDKPERFTNLFIIFTVLLFDFIMDRYDVFPMIMLLGAIYMFTEEKYAWAWTFLAFGTVTKLYPALVAPIFLISLLLRKEYKESVKGIAICLAIGLASLLPFFIADPSTALMFVSYHSDRGLQTEAVVSSVIMLLSMFGAMEISYNYTFGSDNIVGVVPDAVAGYMLPIMAVCLICAYLAYWFIAKKKDDGKLIQMASFLVVMIFMTVNKVLSSQYIVWAIPFMVFLILTSQESIRNKLVGLFVAIIALTQLNLVVNYAFRDAGVAFSDIGIVVILARNVLVIILVAIVIKWLSLQLKKPSGEEL